MAARYESAWVRSLLAWFAVHRRQMPWREHADPYRVWVSEIMLQQTQVATATPYFNRFMARFPSVDALARASQHDVLLAWEGLGYYSRARNLLAAAREVVGNYGGRLPECACELRRLPGIGFYTAAAVASICFGECEPAVDGNVVRVFARFRAFEGDVTGTTVRRQIANRLRPFIPPGEAGDFNQAMMELGAMVCRPRRPSCRDCPLRATCRGRRQNRLEDLPQKGGKRDLPVRRCSAFVVIKAASKVLLVQHSDRAMLSGLWGIPVVDNQALPDKSDLAGAIRSLTGLTVDSVERLGCVRHDYSHFRLLLDVYCCRRTGGTVRGRSKAVYEWMVPGEDARRFPMDRASHKVLSTVYNR
jgi:A/G-specific adenine glycosylase